MWPASWPSSDCVIACRPWSTPTTTGSLTRATTTRVRPDLLAQDVLHDLARPGQRERLGPVPELRHLVPGQPFPAELGQLFISGGALDPDHRGDLLAPVVVGDADHRRVDHRRVGDQDLLDLPRVDVLPAADDHLLEPADDPGVDAVAHGGQVAGW